MQQLKKYERCSGQSINCGKSCFLVGVDADLGQIEVIGNITGFRLTHFPIIYLDVHYTWEEKGSLISMIQ